MTFFERFGVEPVINTLGTSTITGANVVLPAAIAAAAEAMTANMEIDELQRAACRVIAWATGAEAGCVTSSAASGLAISAAAAMTGCDLALILQLPDTSGMRNEVILQAGHDVNFGGRVSQMLRLSGARVVPIGTVNHCDRFHLRGAINEHTAAVYFVYDGAINPDGAYLGVEQCAEIAHAAKLPLIVDAASDSGVRRYLDGGADLVIQSGHKAMGAPTSGMLCGKKDLIRACYLQNWGIGRAMKVGKEGIAGLMVALEQWANRDPRTAWVRYEAIVHELAKQVSVERMEVPHRVKIATGQSALDVANRLREGKPGVWVHDAAGEALILDLRAVPESSAAVLAQRLAEEIASTTPPRENVPYHDLYYSEERLLRWPD